MKYVLAALVLFFANIFFASELLANECHNKALAAAQKADGKVGGAPPGRGPAGAANAAVDFKKPGAELTPEMVDLTSRSLNKGQIELINARARVYKATTGKDLTPEQAMDLITQEGTKKLLGNDMARFEAELRNPGSAAKMLEEARLRQQQIDRAAEEQRRKDDAAWAASQRRAANPYMTNPNAEMKELLKPSSGYDKTNAGMALGSFAPAGTPAVARAFEGVKGAMAEYETRITHLKAALAKPGLAEVHKKALEDKLKRAISACSDLGNVASTAGLNGSGVQGEISSFISRVCR